MEVIEGKIEEVMELTGRRGRKLKQLLEELKEQGGYWDLKREVLDCAMEKLIWRNLWTCLKTAYGMNECAAYWFQL